MKAYVLLVLTALFWASNMVLGKALGHNIPPFTLALGRWLVAAVLILPQSLLLHRPLIKEFRCHWKILTLLGIVGIGGYNTFAYLGLQTTSATNGALLNSFIPIATILLSRLILKRQLTLGEYAGILISFLGVMTIVTQGSLSTLIHLHINPGDFWVLVAVVDWAFYTVMLHWRPKNMPPNLLLSYMVVTGIVVLLPAVYWEQKHLIHPMTLHWGSLMGIVYMGIFPGYLSYIFYNRGVLEIGPNKASLFIHLMPVFGTLLAYLFLHEKIFIFHFVGIGLIMTGIFLTMWIKSETIQHDASDKNRLK